MSKQAIAGSDPDIDAEWKFEHEFARRFFRAIGTPAAVRASLLLDDDLVQLLETDIDAKGYQEPRHFAEDYQIASLLRCSPNVPGLPLEIRQASARKKLEACEARNAETNERLAGGLPDWFQEFSSNVLMILGPLGEPELVDIAEKAAFGPGANVGVRTAGLVPSIKYETAPVCTPGMLNLLNGLMPEMVAKYHDEQGSKPRVVPGTAHFTVPKKWNIERCAAKEPLYNSRLQSGIGSKMAKRLTYFGVDIRDQRRNQELAAMAYEWGLSTVDLSTASDLESYMLICQALTFNGDKDGIRWFRLLCAARSPAMKIAGEYRTLEMFSSMGNGFTFPLETIVFLAMMMTVVPREERCFTAVYGDDMILPKRYASALIDRLEYVGFQVNRTKTCLAGAFFESCGTDWFKGQNVRPFFLRKDPENPAPYPLHVANAMREWALRVYKVFPQHLVSLWNWCKGLTPVAFRSPVPSWMGDCGLHMDLESALKCGVIPAASLEDSDPRCTWEGYVIKTALLPAALIERRRWGVLMAALAHGSDLKLAPSRGQEALRGLFGRVRTGDSVVVWDPPRFHQWLPS
jgi:hypothetical protein